MNLIVKKTIALAMLLALPLLAKAQQPTSILSRFDSPTPSAVIVRSSDTNTVVTYGRHGTPSNPSHQFVVHDLASGQSREFYLGQTSLLGDYVSQVLDMRVLDGVCYFCGEYQKVVDEIVHLDGRREYLTEPRGLVGWFKVQDVLDGSGDFQLMMVPRAARLVRMTAFYGHGQELALMGDPYGDTRHRLMARVLLTLNPTPTYWTEVLQNNDLELTDIWGGNSLLAVVMRYSSNLPADHYRYAVSWNKAIPTPNTLNNLFVVNAPFSIGGSLREFGADLRLIGLSGSELAVAYPGSRDAAKGYTVHRFSLWLDNNGLNRMAMTEHQFADLVFGGDYAIEDVSFLPDRKLLPVTLIDANGRSALNWTEMGRTADYISNGLCNGHRELLSSDALDPRHVVAVGTDPAGDPLLTVKKDNWLAHQGFNCLTVTEAWGEIKDVTSPRWDELIWEQQNDPQLTINNFPFRSERIRHSEECRRMEPLPQINSDEQ